MRTKREPTLIASVRRALQLLEATAAHENGVTAKRLARETALPLGTTYHLLRTLAHEGYLRKLDSGGFVLGAALDALRDQGTAQAQLTRLRPSLAALRDELGVATYLACYDSGEVRIVDIADGPKTPRVHGLVDLHEAAHASALGKCLLRQLDEDSRRDYLSRHPPFDLTPYTVTQSREVIRRLTGSLSQRLEWDQQEYELGTGCAALPVAYGDAPGALAVSFPINRRPAMEAAVDQLASTARTMTYALSLTM